MRLGVRVIGTLHADNIYSARTARENTMSCYIRRKIWFYIVHEVSLDYICCLDHDNLRSTVMNLKEK
ncbi:unnamed protein product [Linum tenue]|uniref:Uncharacterized protein n=1 Tax=Linum tenue TaxID=586396 RepID=A0AAV0H0Q7_9ROSI|nr:unnamed protein product [Linum tenue]